MNFKKIIALICALSILCTSAAAFTPFLPEDIAEQEQEKENGQQEENKTEEGKSEEGKTEEGKTEADEIPQKPTGVIKPDFNVYAKLFRQILDAYVQNHLYEFTAEEVMYKFFDDFLRDNPMYFKFMTNYLLGTMDPYSSYHEVDDGFLDGDHEAIGFGIIIGEDENGRVIVDDIVEGGNAEKAGILAGDKFVSVMGMKVDDLPIDAVTTIIANINHFLTEEEKLKDEESIVYSFEFEREGKIIPISLTKGIMVTGSINSYIEDNDGRTTGVITLAAFLGSKTVDKFSQALKEFSDKGIKNLTIDLRDNGGGNLEYALSMAECFIPEGELICYYNDRTLEEPRPIYSTTDYVTFDSIAILVNEHTASAAELFSNILRQKGLAKLVGTNTYGKGIGQTVFALANGDYITITTYEILDANLENYNGRGLKPDLEIEMTEMCYTLPTLGYFNHENYKEIKEGVFSEPAKALEDRLNVAGFLDEKYCDGIFDDTTKRALYALQLDLSLTPTGVLDDETVTKITRLINAYKTYTYFEDSQYEVSLYMHRSFSQGKRRLSEFEDLAKKEKKKIDARNEALEAAIDAADKAAEEAKKQQQAQDGTTSQSDTPAATDTASDAQAKVESTQSENK